MFEFRAEGGLNGMSGIGVDGLLGVWSTGWRMVLGWVEEYDMV